MPTVYSHLSELITNQGVVQKGGAGITEKDLSIIQDGALVLDDSKKVIWIGKTQDLPKKYSKYKNIKLSQKILAPCLTDCHTHLVFAGHRYHELAMRLEGATYQEIAKAGGGIKYSVSETARASESELFKQSCPHVDHLLKLGVGILEIKSGYGLDWEVEKKILRVIQKLKVKYSKQMIIRSTFLGAHAFPKWANDDLSREKFVDQIINEMIPEVAKLKLADACDVFFDEGYFNKEQSSKILKKAKAYGLQIKLHADELANTKGAHLASELGALSADHLLKADEQGLKKMADAGVVAVLLPTTAFFLQFPYADIQKMRKAKVCLALSSDFNPGTSPTFHIPFVMSLACLQMKMTMPEAFAAATYGGARALGLHDQQGSIQVGKRPKLAIFNVPSFKALIANVAHPGLCEKII